MATEVYHVSYRYTANVSQFTKGLTSAQRLQKSFEKTLATGRASLRSYAKDLGTATAALKSYNNALRSNTNNAKLVAANNKKIATSATAVTNANRKVSTSQSMLNRTTTASAAKMKAYGLTSKQSATNVAQSASAYNVLSNSQRKSLSTMTQYTATSKTFAAQSVNMKNSIISTGKAVDGLSIKNATLSRNVGVAASSLSRMNLKQVGQNMQTAAQKTETMANKLMLLSAASGLVFYGITKVGMSFEKNFANVAKTVQSNAGVTEKGMQQLKRELIDLSRTIPIPFERLTEYATMAGQMAVPIQSIKTFTNTFAQLEVATDLAGESGAKLFAQYMNIMGLKFNKKNITEFGDTLVHLGNNTAATEKDILALAQRMAPTARIMKLTSKETLGLSAGLGSMGQKPQFAAGAFQRLGRTISEAVGKGGENLKHFAKISGMSSDEFVKSWRERPLETMKKVATGLKEVSKDQTDYFTELRKMKVINTQDARLMIIMAENWDKIDNSIKLTTKSTGALYNEFVKKNDTVAARLQITKNIFASIGNSLYEKIVPNLKKVLDAFNQFLIGVDDKVRGLSSTQATIITAVAAIGAALMPLILVFSKIAGGVGVGLQKLGELKAIMGGVSSGSKGMTLLANGLQKVGTMLTRLVSPIGIVIAVLVLLYVKFESFRNMVNSVMGSIFGVIKNVFSKIVEAIQRMGAAFQPLQNEFNNVLTSITPLVDFISGVLQPVLTLLVELMGASLINAIEMFVTAFENIMTIVTAVSQALRQLFSGDFSGAADTIGQAFGKIFDNIVRMVKECVMNIVVAFAKVGINIMPVIKVIVDVFKAAWDGIKAGVSALVSFFQTSWNVIKTTVSTVVDVIVTIFTGMWSGIKAGFNAFVTFVGVVLKVVTFPFLVAVGIIVSLFEVLVAALKALFTGFVNFFAPIFQPVVAFFQGAVSMIGTIFTTVFDFIKNYVTNIINAIKIVIGTIKNVVSTILNAVKTTFSNIWNSISGVVSKVINKILSVINNIKTRVSSVLSSVKSVFSSVWNSVATVVSGVINRIVTIINKIKSAVSNVTSGIKSAFTNAFDSVATYVSGVIDKILGWLNGMAEKGKAFLDKLNPFNYEFNYGGGNDPIPFGDGGDTYNYHTYNIQMKDTSASSIMALKNKEAYFQ